MGAFDDVLLSVAKSISDGAHVDWTRLRDSQNDAHAADVLTEMAVVERIAAFHGSTEPMPTTTDQDGSERVADPPAWGHFKILGRVGGGSFSAVYRAENIKLQSEVALKLLRPGASDRMLREAQLLARVRHPNVVTVHGADCLDGRVGIWMELVKGRTLASLLREHGPFGAREAAIIGFDLCRALAAVHRARLIHSDVKAHNVMREEGGRIVLMDFGTGKEIADAPPQDTLGQRPASDFAGTPLYLAPEVFEGEPRSKMTDIYSLGVLLHHLVTGTYPVVGRTVREIEEAHRQRTRESLRDVRPDLPVEFIATVERALEHDPRDRFQTAGAFEAALAPLIGRVSNEQPHPRPRWLWPLAATVAAVLALGGALAYRQFSGATSSDAPPVAVPGQRTDPVAATPGVPASAGAQSEYRIDTAVYRVRGSEEDRLRPGARVAPGDMVFAKIRVSIPAYVYIVNEDDQGESFLLFPLPGQSVTNPLPAGTTSRIPGSDGRELLNWQITSAGGREHFLIFASAERLLAFEQMFAALPQPTVGKPVVDGRLSQKTVGQLRSIGGLAASTERPYPSRLSLAFPTPLGDGEETARGLWVRQFTVVNPVP